MTEGSRLDPMLLSAWVDQELDATDQARVEARLAANPAEAELVRRWKHDRDALQARLAPLADEPLPDSLLQLLDGTRRESWRRAALAASLLIAGGFIYHLDCLAAGKAGGVGFCASHIGCGGGCAGDSGSADGDGGGGDGGGCGGGD